jgi:hypothetical protein
VSTAVATRTQIALEAACVTTGCREMAEKMHRQLDTEHYTTGVSILPLPSTFADWRAEHRTARKRADRAERLGYRFAEVDRAQFNDDIHAINTSKQERQGRPMSAGDLQRHNHGSLPDYPCERHRIHTYGVLECDRLRAYLSLYRIGDLGMVSMILGHGDHLANDVMYLLAAGVIEDQTRHGGSLYYNRHDSGTDGLRYYKERLGFERTDIEWVLA